MHLTDTTPLIDLPRHTRWWYLLGRLIGRADTITDTGAFIAGVVIGGLLMTAVNAAFLLAVIGAHQ